LASLQKIDKNTKSQNSFANPYLTLTKKPKETPLKSQNEYQLMEPEFIKPAKETKNDLKAEQQVRPNTSVAAKSYLPQDIISRLSER
jgi:hypothetical protein